MSVLPGCVLTIFARISLTVSERRSQCSRDLAQEVCRSLGLDLRGQTSASYNMRLNYEKSLLDFEHYLSSGSYAADVAAGAAMLIYGAWDTRNLQCCPVPTAI